MLCDLAGGEFGPGRPRRPRRLGLLCPWRLEISLGRLKLLRLRFGGGGGRVFVSRLQHRGATMQDVRESGTHHSPPTHALDCLAQARRQTVKDVLNHHPLERLAQQNRIIERRFILPAADWAAWQPGIYQVGRLVRRPGGPPRQMLK